MPIWQEARNLHKEILSFTELEGFSRDFRLKDQIRASSGSVMDNIAEGFGRGGNKELINFLTIARGSNDETRSQIHQAFARGYLAERDFESYNEQSKSLSDQITAFIIYLQRAEHTGSKFKRTA
ncbi:MAG: four helix bundle protein [Bacteroidia bacterium]